MRIMMVILLTFCLPLVASAEMQQLVCTEIKPVPANDDDSGWAKSIRNNCADEQFSQTYTITMDDAFLSSKQSFQVELAYSSCRFPRPYDDGMKRLTVSSNELRIFHYGLTHLVINRNDLRWIEDHGFGTKYSDNRTCEIKDIDTSQRKI
jgi:hypothetical protein